MKALEAARANDVNLMFLSGNQGFWKTRWEDNYTTIVCYKETQNNGVGDYRDPTDTWTGIFRDRRPFATDGSQFNSEHESYQPENALFGTIFTVNFDNTLEDKRAYEDKVKVPAKEAAHRLWRNVTIPASRELNIPLGHEWDEDLDNGFRPSGLLRLSETTEDEQFEEDYVQRYIIDPNFRPAGTGSFFDATALPGYNNSQDATHSLTMYRGSRKGLVFSAGMSSWSQALVPDPGPNPPSTSHHDYKVKQATINLLADMGVIADEDYLESTTNLHVASGSADTTPPQTPSLEISGVFVTENTTSWTFEGTATDVGGKVGGVEVSWDGGVTWKRAFSGTPAASLPWSHSVVLPTTPVPFVLTCAVDDSFNMEKVKAALNSNTQTLYVYGGGTSTSGPWDNDILITKNGTSFTVTNNGNAVSVPAGAVSSIVVQLALGTNRIQVTDPNIPLGWTREQVNDAAATVAGSLTILGGIGKDTVILDHIKIGNGLTIKGNTGADTVNLLTSVIASGNANIDMRLNGNGSVDSKSVGAVVNVNDGYVLNGALTVNTGVGNDQLALDKMIIVGSPAVATRGGNDRISRGTASPSYPNIRGGDGDDTYVYAVSVPVGGGESLIEDAGRGSDTLDFSAATISITVNLSTSFPNFENLRGGSANDNLTGNSANNTLQGNGGIDTLTGDAGIDTLSGGGGNDILNGGEGNDTYVYSGIPSEWGTDATITDGSGTDTLDFSGASEGQAVDLNLAKWASIENVRGTKFADTISGNPLVNTFHGGQGNDTYQTDATGNTTIHETLDGDTDVVKLVNSTTGAKTHVFVNGERFVVAKRQWQRRPFAEWNDRAVAGAAGGGERGHCDHRSICR